jgi:hypothetical protein
LITKTFLLDILKQTKEGKIVNLNGFSDVEINEACKKGLIEFDNGKILVNSLNRLAIAVEAINLGVDFEKVCRLLDWREFEEFSSIILEYNGYSTFKRFIFKEGKTKKWEIDVLGIKDLAILCLDCKKWRYGWYKSKLSSAAEKHFKRVKAFSRELPNLTLKLRIKRNESFMILPLLITLADASYRSLNGVLIVSILRFKSFLYELPEIIYSESDLLIKASS